MCRQIGKFLMLIMTTLPSTLIIYLWAVLVWQWQNWLCLSEKCLKWKCRSKVPPNARCVPSYDFSSQRPVEIHKQVVAVYGNVMNRQNVTECWRESLRKSLMMMMRCKKKSWRGSKGWRQTSMTRGYRSWFQDSISEYLEYKESK